MDLSNLDALSNIVVPDAPSDGKPVDWPLAKIIPGDNPRTKFDADYLERLSRSIKRRGVKSPISLKPATSEEVQAYFKAAGLPMPDSTEEFAKINHGECRVRASRLAGRETIPAFIDIEHDGIDALTENIQRRDLDPLDIAVRIQRYVDDGMSKSSIAEELGYSPSYVSNHLKLLALPEPVALLVREGKSSDVTALLSLGSAYGDYPEQITAFCAEVEEFTQRQVRELVARLKSPPPAQAPTDQAGQQPGMQEEPGPTGGADMAPTSLQDSSTPSTNEDHSIASDVPPLDGKQENSPALQGAASKAPQEKKSRVTGIEIRHDGRPARLLLKIPTEAGLAWIKYEDDGQEKEISADTIQQVVSVAVE